MTMWNHKGRAIYINDRSGLFECNDLEVSGKSLDEVKAKIDSALKRNAVKIPAYFNTNSRRYDSDHLDLTEVVITSKHYRGYSREFWITILGKREAVSSSHLFKKDPATLKSAERYNELKKKIKEMEEESEKLIDSIRIDSDEVTKQIEGTDKNDVKNDR